MRVLCVFLAFIALLIASCIPIPYAYPTLDRTPLINAKAPANELKVFRVDLKEHRSGGPWSWSETRTFKPIALNADCVVESQHLTGIRHGVFWHLIALDYSWYTRDLVNVCLYRPGFRTVQIREGNDSTTVQWREAITLQEQEIALDLIHLSQWQLSRLKEDRNQRAPSDKIGSVSPGSFSTGHRDVLNYLANEYERLAARFTKADAIDLARLLGKANDLRLRADE